MPWTSPRAGVIDGLGYLWCLTCESRARTEGVTKVYREPTGGGAFYLPQCSDELDGCEGCGKKLVSQPLPRSVRYEDADRNNLTGAKS